MINDKQRREAARGIRQFLSVSQDKRAWDNDGLQTVGRLIGTSVGENILVRLADLIDRPTCCNVYDEIYDEYEGGRCENGFKCSKCGEIVEDCEGYRVTGTFNYCPKCGREVVSE